MTEDDTNKKQKPAWRAGGLVATIAAALAQVAVPADAHEQVRQLIARARESGVRALRDHGRVVRQLVFKPSRSGGFVLAGHVSHSSHASHASHASHYSGSSESAPAPTATPSADATPTPQPPPEDSGRPTPTPRPSPSDSRRPTPTPTTPPTPTPRKTQAYRVTLRTGQVLVGTVVKQLGGYLITYHSNNKPVQLWLRTDEVKSIESAP